MDDDEEWEHYDSSWVEDAFVSKAPSHIPSASLAKTNIFTSASGLKNDDLSPEDEAAILQALVDDDDIGLAKNLAGNVLPDSIMSEILAFGDLKRMSSAESTLVGVCQAAGSQKMSLVDPQWENIDPNPDIHALCQQFNKEFFWGTLASVEVKWSKQMTLCAGICRYQSRAGYCSIGLSLPLLKLRPRKDLVETLLHEMIHAYLFVASGDREHESHGPLFHAHMYRINKSAGTKISVYHNFHDEVDFYRQHIWRCDGPCRNRRPFMGFVKRSRNRPPGPTDFWHAEHQKTCGGTFIKIKEPEGFGQKKRKRDKLDPEGTEKPGKKLPANQRTLEKFVVSGEKELRHGEGGKTTVVTPGSPLKVRSGQMGKEGCVESQATGSGSCVPGAKPAAKSPVPSPSKSPRQTNLDKFFSPKKKLEKPSNENPDAEELRRRRLAVFDRNPAYVSESRSAADDHSSLYRKPTITTDDDVIVLE